ncbi:hypothetical protein JQN72_01960 [Phycicoccus sp. CSK15P-2]|uniref:hypothetical protein n=1 Tax=Phycicoccus sp. CSK15P-2 TaxID=2807627 RepID=UPI001951A193|nr:hypothetical protein [Phycicoccus sp. CSK15P-2]MBM6403013.1 hypothetical protein [Phycicoccus sp. CSK15P-2]
MPRDLPDELASTPFTVAHARELGLRQCDLRALGLHRPTHAVRAAQAPSTVLERARAWAAALPADAAFSHVTAAQLLGLPLPGDLEGSVVLDVMRPSDSVASRRRGCRGHRGLESREVVTRHGLRVVAGPDTWCDLAGLKEHALSVHDLVVVGGAVLGSSGDEAGALAAALAGRCRPRGAVRLAEALALLRPGVRSPMETRARLMFVDAGFPEPEVNGAVGDRHGGRLLEGDLVWRDQRVVGEYQGEAHADRRRRSADAHRAGIARDEGWTVLELWAEDVLRGPRRRTTLTRFAVALGLDVRTLRIS